MKNVFVKCGKWTQTMSIDETIFDEYKVEACTRAIESRFKNGDVSITAFMQCSDILKNNRVSKTCSIYNTYKILINAGFHIKAELLRNICLRESDVDLAQEPIKG